MKRIIFLAVLSCFIPATSWALPVTVSFDPQDSIVQVGDTFTVDLMADLPAPVVGWGLDVTFDSAILTQVGSPLIGPAWNPGFAMDGDGLAGLAFPAVSGSDILLATLTFEATALGTSDLMASITPFDLTEGFPLAFPAPPGSFADVVFETGSVSPVPEPTTMLLVGSGLIGLAGLRKKFRA